MAEQTGVVQECLGPTAFIHLVCTCAYFFKHLCQREALEMCHFTETRSPIVQEHMGFSLCKKGGSMNGRLVGPCIAVLSDAAQVCFDELR